ncbi:hypothetical protein AB0I00_25045 [Streptomyces sp. NPDC050803]|uniref:hypothetical protein n=1 Tax=unclassified Streptomyces TaxID=2593676 RepID=UPI003427131E
MTLDDVQLSAAHPTWWKAPLLATIPGLPLLVLEFALMWPEDGLGYLGGTFYWATGLLALAWALPHRRSLQAPRMLAAGAGLLCAVLPLLLMVMMAMAMA